MNNLKPKNGFRGWKYPIDKFSFYFNDDYQSVTDLYRHVREFEKVNKLKPIDDLEDVLEDYFCRTCEYFRQFCVEVDNVVTTKDKIRRVVSGSKAVLKIKVKSAINTLKVLPVEEVAENVSVCDGCSLNQYADQVGHDNSYVHNVEKAYGVKDIKLLHQPGHENLGQCYGCGCKTMTKVFLHEENYGKELTASPHDINKLLHARTGNGAMCWQLRRVLLPEHLSQIVSEGKITYQNLRLWGYI